MISIHFLRAFHSRQFFTLSLFAVLLHGSSSFALTLEERVLIEAKQTRAVLPLELAQNLQQKHVVFVDGIMNELAKIPQNYYTDYIRVLRRNGISFSHLAYPSRVAIPKNAKLLAKDLFRISGKVKKPIILIGHSMGGAEALYAVLKKPMLLLEGLVERVVIFEGAIGGSPLAEELKPKGLPRLIQKILGPGLDSLRPSVARLNFEDVRLEFGLFVWQHFADETDEFRTQIFKELSDRVLYIQSQKVPGKPLSWGLRVILPLMKTPSLGEEGNDGLLKLEDQILPDFGRSLGIFNADHIELVVSGPVSHSSSKYRQAFARALLKTLYSEELPEGSDERAETDFN